MAEVLSPILPRSDLAVPRLQNRSSPSPPSTPTQMPRSHNVGSGYRGTAAAPVAPYAFKTTPQLRPDGRTASTSPRASPPASPLPPPASSSMGHQRYPATSSVSSTASAPSSNPPVISQLFLPKDNFDLMSDFTSGTSFMDSQESKPSAQPFEAARKVPERYHRVQKQGRPDSSGSLQNGVYDEDIVVADARDKMAAASLYDGPGSRPESRSTSSRPDSSHAAEETEVFTSAGQSENTSGLATPKRYKRRTGSGDYGGSKTPSSTAIEVPQNISKPFAPRPDANSISSRTYSSADSVRRINNPSPLSRPLDLSETATSPAFSAGHVRDGSQTSNSNNTQSPATAAMAALNVAERDPGKHVKSRLRRAFSFGSSQELKRASEPDAAAERAKARQDRFSNELDEEQDAIARKQEAAGLGNSIYSGQGNIFQGSTDNLSISSTASSASLMLRKMGRGMKKGGRSIKGLFRPKSVIGVPAADEPEATVGSVSMVTVEAERQNVNVDLHPSREHNGVDSYPKLERNSIDANRAAVPVPIPQNDQRTAIDGDREALAAAKRGILKRSATDSPQHSPAFGPVDADRTPRFSPSYERRPSPAPSSTSSEPRQSRHRRTDSSTINGDDYFATLPRLPNNRSSRSLPGTPRSGRNITFSPRIQFHDVWSSQDYDRRGEIATCNRLTPLLAQQIKEELNNFKMEMEVHELSKPHTHFF